jgi:hypothetical protein
MDKAVVQAELHQLGRRIAVIRQRNVIGFSIMGSFTLGAWSQHSSDLDFLALLKQLQTW